MDGYQLASHHSMPWFTRCSEFPRKRPAATSGSIQIKLTVWFDNMRFQVTSMLILPHTLFGGLSPIQQTFEQATCLSIRLHPTNNPCRTICSDRRVLVKFTTVLTFIDRIRMTEWPRNLPYCLIFSLFVVVEKQEYPPQYAPQQQQGMYPPQEQQPMYPPQQQGMQYPPQGVPLQTTQTIVVQQFGDSGQPRAQNVREFSTGLCDCFVDCGSCKYLRCRF